MDSMLNGRIKREFYFMVAGEVVFTVPGTEGFQVMRLNAVVTNPSGEIPVLVLSRAQQALQLQFRNRLEDPKIEVADVVIINMFNLGRFTKEEFHAKPEGVALQEKARV